jgi:Oxidoreductase molybdopterin binding domain
MNIYRNQSIKSANGKLGTAILTSNPRQRVGSRPIKRNKQDPLSTRHPRIFPLAMVALLAAVIGLSPKARAEDVPPPISGTLGKVQSVGTNSTQEGNSMEAIGLSIDLATAQHPQTLLATHLDGKPLTVEHGAPLRLLVP